MTDTTKQIAGVDVERLMRNLDETSYNEGAIDLAARLSDCKAVIEELLAARATPVSPAQPVAEVLAAEFGRRVAFLGGGRDLPKVGTKLYTAPVPAPATSGSSDTQPVDRDAVLEEAAAYHDEQKKLTSGLRYCWVHHKSADAIRALKGKATQAERQPQPAAQSAVPEGWKLVPIEPTDDMCRSAREIVSISANVADHVFRTMVAAAPAAVPQGAEAQKGGADHG